MRHTLTAAALLAACALAHADEQVLKNDSFTDGGSINLCPCFAANEEAAVWLTTPCDGAIVGIQIYWKSFFGGDEQKIEDSIRIYEAGTFPNPGPLIDELLAPVLTDGFMNEYRYYDESLIIPINIPVSAGETFVVSLKFFNSNANDPFAGSIGSDSNGCQPGKNAVKINGTTWTNACALGVSGDWVIRAIVDCGGGGDPQGSCCLPDGSCDDGLTLADCQAADGFWNGAGSLCATEDCAGACYIPSTMACIQFPFSTCDAVGGDWFGPGSTDCQDDDCPADCDANTELNLDDIDCFISGFLASDLNTADCDGNAELNLDDIDCFIAAFFAGCP